MSLFDRGLRGNVQSPFSSSLDASTTSYTNPRLLGDWNGNVQLAIDYLLDAVYPNYKGTVPNVAALPITAVANDFYIVNDDGDGKSAGYVYSVIQGMTQWIKRYDVDWSYEQILSDTIDSTQYMYAHKYGVTDRDANGNTITGLYGGQRIYGGEQTAQNMTLTANIADGTGYVQTTNTFRPAINNTYDLGTSVQKWRSGYFTTSAFVGTATLTSGSLTDSSGALSFGSNNLTTTGSVTSSAIQIGTMSLVAGSITDSSGAIDFGTANLTTSGTIHAATSSVLADITFTNGTLSTGSGSFSFSNQDLASIGQLTSSKVVTGEIDVGNLVLSGQTLSTDSGATALILQAGSGGNTTTVQVNSAIQLNFDATVTGTLTVNGSGTHTFTGPIQVGTALKISTNTANGKLESLIGDLQLVPTGNISAFGKIVPNADNTRDLGSTALRFKDVYFAGSIGDGNTVISNTTLQSLRAINVGVQLGNILAWDGTKWIPESTNGVIDHTTLTNLTSGDSGHTQFPLLAGRAGGQTISGGTASGNSLTLDSTTNSTKGFVLVSSPVAPTTDASYSAGWVGTNLGSASRNFNDIFSKGIHYGLRLDPYAGSGTYPTNSGQNVGRVIYDTTVNQLLIDTGTTWTKVGQQKWSSDTSWDGVTTTKAIDVSSLISDARTALWQFCDNTNSFERMFVKITTTQTIVTITVSPALPAGTYRLIGLN